MLTIGIILTILGVLACAFGAVQNTILFAIFADIGAKLARFNDELDFHITWLFFGPGTITMIIGVILIAAGIMFIVLSRKRKSLSGYYGEEE